MYSINQTSSFLPLTRYENKPWMCSSRLIHSQYRHQRVIETFGELIIFCNKQGLTHISQITLYLAIIGGVGYDVHRYITTGQLPYTQWSEEQLWTDEEEW
jgi:hypothetical protein